MTSDDARDQTRDKALVEVLAAHDCAQRVAEPRNNADRNLGRTRYEMRCTCGALLPWTPQNGEPLRAHVADVLAAYVATKQAEAIEVLAKEAKERGDIGRPGQIEVWDWLTIRARAVREA